MPLPQPQTTNYTARFPFYKQLDMMDCEPNCLRMIAKHYGKHYSLQYLREHSYIDREGVSLMGISDAAEHIGMHTLAVRLDFDKLKAEVPLPCIAHWRQRHFVVVHKITRNRVYVADPAFGLVKYKKKEFLRGWISARNEGIDEGILLLLEPTPEFYEYKGEKSDRTGFIFLFSYFLICGSIKAT